MALRGVYPTEQKMRVFTDTRPRKFAGASVAMASTWADHDVLQEVSG